MVARMAEDLMSFEVVDEVGELGWWVGREVILGVVVGEVEWWCRGGMENGAFYRELFWEVFF